jgi:NAD(P)-dependent dehydrogenase (short-subunit alcohol dehydrogenase family)
MFQGDRKHNRLMQLNGSTAIISGGMGDIGRAIGRELASYGANIAIGDILEATDASSFLAELQSLGVRAIYRQVDVSDPAAVSAWFVDVTESCGIPDLIIPNAAVVTLSRFRDLTPEQWQRDMRINLDGAFYMSQTGAKLLVTNQKQGRIVFIGSWVGATPQDHIPAYCVTKAGVSMLTKVLALDLAPHGILVNEVAPGNVDAGLSARIFEQNPAWRQVSIDRVPIKQLTLAEEVAFQVAHLCDPRNKQMTGSTLLMDGGLSLMSGPNPA